MVHEYMDIPLTEEEIGKMTEEELLCEDMICAILDEPDKPTQYRLYCALIERAETFGAAFKKKVDGLYKVYKKDMKEKKKERSARNNDFDRYTDFGDKYAPMKCGSWRADMSGVYNPDALPKDRVACYHPILPIQIITNVDEGNKKVRIAFCLNGRWDDRIVPKSIIADKSKIIRLSDEGVLVTSETAKNLVNYLAEVERLNLESIPEVQATSKMGWRDDGFMPFNSSLDFDKDGRFDKLFSTIGKAGSREKYMDFVKKVRSSGRVEPRLVMAASLASVLVKPCGLLPFWVNIWGRSGGGKSVCGMLAASIWADPEIGKYISKFDSTITAFEAKASFLNHLPFVIDDTAEIKRKLKDDFSQLIYQLASGEGRDRSNTKLGLAHKTTWGNVIICSGETPLINDGLQGGAINRVLEYEVDDGDIFEDGQAAATLLRSNYGFLGKEFVEVLEQITLSKVCELQQECFDLIKHFNFEDKQLRSLSAILAADKIATEYIFKDNKALRLDEVMKVLADKATFSENERCYEYIISECMVNENKFMTTGEHTGEYWGFIYHPDSSNLCDEYYAILPSVYQRICEQGKFSSKAFSSWATKKGLMISGDGKNHSKKLTSPLSKGQSRYYVIKTSRPEE